MVVFIKESSLVKFFKVMILQGFTLGEIANAIGVKRHKVKYRLSRVLPYNMRQIQKYLRHYLYKRPNKAELLNTDKGRYAYMMLLQGATPWEIHLLTGLSLKEIKYLNNLEEKGLTWLAT